MCEQTRKCSKCGEVKATTEFYKARGGKYGVMAVCKPCHNLRCSLHRRSNPELAKEIQARYRSRNPSKVRESRKRYAEANPDKVRESARIYRKKNSARKLAEWRNRNAMKNGARGSHTAEQLKARFDYHGNKCVYCGLTENLHADHQIPLSRGGTNFASNMVPACATCNCSKGSKKPEEFLVYQFNIAMEKLING